MAGLIYKDYLLSSSFNTYYLKCKLAMHNLHMMMGYVHDTVLAPIPAETDDEDELLLYGGVNFMAGDIDNAKTFVRN